MVTYRPSADRVEYSTMTDAARRRYLEEQQRWQDLFEQRMAGPTGPTVEQRDISQYVTPQMRGEDVDAGSPFQGTYGQVTADDNNPLVLNVAPPEEDGLVSPYDIERIPEGERRSTEEPLELTYRYQTRDADNPARTSVAPLNLDRWSDRIKAAIDRKQQILAEEEGNLDLPGRGSNNPVLQTAGYKAAYYDPQQQKWVGGDAPPAEEMAKLLGGNHVFLGWEDGTYGGGGVGVRAKTMDADYAMEWVLLPEEMQQEVMALTLRYYTGMEPDFSWIEKRWNKAITIAKKAFNQGNLYMTPFEAYDEVLISEFVTMSESNRTGGGRGYGFSGSGGGGTISLTSPSDALYLLNQAMTQYLGRRATEQELRDFVAALNAQERANPTTVAYEGGQAVQSGGFNPAVFAQQFAQSQEGSAEFQATTTFMDAFLQMLGGRIGE